MKILWPILLLFLFAGCAPGQYGPIHVNPQDEKLFAQGLEELEAGDSSPSSFERLRVEYPESLFTRAASGLLEGRRVNGELQAKNQRLDTRQSELERQLAQVKVARDTCQGHNRNLASQIQELEANLEKFKQILLETEQRTP